MPEISNSEAVEINEAIDHGLECIAARDAKSLKLRERVEIAEAAAGHFLNKCNAVEFENASLRTKLSQFDSVFASRQVPWYKRQLTALRTRCEQAERERDELRDWKSKRHLECCGHCDIHHERIEELEDSLHGAALGERDAEAKCDALQAANTALQEKLGKAEGRLLEISKAADADAADLEKMRDGTKLTRHGIVQLLAYQQQDIKEFRARIATLEAQLAEKQSVVQAVSTAKRNNRVTPAIKLHK